jgi:hypothetical protein
MDYKSKQEALAEVNEEAIVYHGIEDALIGYAERFGQPMVAVYDYEKVLACLIGDSKDEDAYEQAVEWYNHNTLGTWAGEGTPIFLHKFEEEKQCRFWTTLRNSLTKGVSRIMATLKGFGRLLLRGGKPSSDSE